MLSPRVLLAAMPDPAAAAVGDAGAASRRRITRPALAWRNIVNTRVCRGRWGRGFSRGLMGCPRGTESTDRTELNSTNSRDSVSDSEGCVSPAKNQPRGRGGWWEGRIGKTQT